LKKKLNERINFKTVHFVGLCCKIELYCLIFCIYFI